MGKKRIITVTEEGLQKKVAKKSLKKEKGVHIPGLKGGERVVAVMAEPPTSEKVKKPEAPKRRGLPQVRARGKKYLAAKTKIDPQKAYSIPEAIKLLKETHFARFDGSAELHLATLKPGLHGEVVLPNFAGKTKKVEIADEQTLKKIESGKIDFDILISTPAFMPKLIKYAKILGPRGLMPNPKTATIVEDPEKAIKKFQKTSISFKTEQNAPLIHAVFGKISQNENELAENLKTFLSTVGTKNLKKAVISSTMGPGIKLDLSLVVDKQ